MQPLRSLRLRTFNSQELDQISYDPGEIFFDSTNSTLRLLTGSGNRGGESVATHRWTQDYLTSQLTNVSQSLRITDTTASTSTLTGSLTTAGGLGVGGAVNAVSIKTTTATFTSMGVTTTSAGTITADAITLTAQGTQPNSLVTKAYIDSKIWLALAVGY